MLFVLPIRCGFNPPLPGATTAAVPISRMADVLGSIFYHLSTVEYQFAFGGTDVTAFFQSRTETADGIEPTPRQSDWGSLMDELSQWMVEGRGHALPNVGLKGEK